MVLGAQPLTLSLIPHVQADSYGQEMGKAQAGLWFLWFLVLSVCLAGASAVPSPSPAAFLDTARTPSPGGLDLTAARFPVRAVSLCQSLDLVRLVIRERV